MPSYVSTVTTVELLQFVSNSVIEALDAILFVSPGGSASTNYRGAMSAKYTCVSAHLESASLARASMAFRQTLYLKSLRGDR